MAKVTPFGDVAIDIGDVVGSDSGDGREGGRRRVGTALDPVYLSIFAHRFMGIAEQMGRTLQVTHIPVPLQSVLYLFRCLPTGGSEYFFLNPCACRSWLTS